MGKKEAEKPAPAPAAEAAPAKKGLPVKLIGVVAVVMILEAVGVVTVFSMIGPKKSNAEVGAASMKNDPGEETEEILIVEDKFQNLQQGKVWFWDLAVYVIVKSKNSETVEGKLHQRNAEIKEGISRIIKRAQPAQLKEPDSQTLNRQIGGYLGEIFGKDEKDQSLIERIVIPRCRGIPANIDAAQLGWPNAQDLPALSLSGDS